MQDNSESNAKPSILSEKLFIVIKGIFVLILGVILLRTFHQKHQNLNDLSNEFSHILISENILSLILLFLLIFVNWACEAKKWQILTNKFENLNFIDAFQSVLVGLSLGFITPANLGDFAGRTLHLKKINRSAGIGTNLLGNGIQFYVTLMFGILSYLIIWNKNIALFDQIIFCCLIFGSILGVFVFLKRNKITNIFEGFNWIKPYQGYLKAITEFNNSDFWKVMIWTILRFLTYSWQFVIVLKIFQIQLELTDLWAISCLVLLFKTLIPPLNFLSDLGIREISALHFFSYFSTNISPVITATFVLWFINILFPVLIGGFIFLKMKNTNKSNI